MFTTDGTDGMDGTDGIDGMDGTDCTNGTGIVQVELVTVQLAQVLYK